ncbi:YbaB/EbfC family DNA-binding protein [Polaromonas sp. YR568]|uniref:YbaB/EbfC family DNA-binding protein n=1 Tax=Polaromonas sp. YR568 TaxID=1855301 RepID=UPI00398BD01A
MTTPKRIATSRPSRASRASNSLPTRPGALARLWRGLQRTLGWVGIGLSVSAAPMAAQAQAPAQPVPQHWISYAQLVGNQLQDRLGDAASEPVVRLHAWMQERLLKEGQAVPAQPLVVRLWIAPNGQVSKLEFASLGQAQADADLRGLLTAQPLSEPPPRDMRQPMVLELAMSFASPT